jgi:hypothetical protein
MASARDLHPANPRGPHGLWHALASAVSADQRPWDDDVEIDLVAEERAHLRYLARVAGPADLGDDWFELRSA